MREKSSRHRSFTTKLNDEKIPLDIIQTQIAGNGKNIYKLQALNAQTNLVFRPSSLVDFLLSPLSPQRWFFLYRNIIAPTSLEKRNTFISIVTQFKPSFFA